MSRFLIRLRATSVTLAVLLAVAAPTAIADELTEEIILDLATLDPGRPHEVAVPAERPYKIVVANKVPSARYAFHHARMTSYSARESVDDIVFRIHGHPGCEDLVLGARRVFAAEDEKDVAGLLGAEGTLTRLGTETSCGEAASTLRSLRKSTRGLAHGTDGQPPESTAELTIERLGGPSGAAVKTWPVHLRAGSVKRAWAHPSEEAWLLDAVVRDVLEMLLFASDRRSPIGTLQLDLQPDPAQAVAAVRARWAKGALGDARVGLAESVWSASAYEPLVQDVMRALRLRPAKPRSQARSLVEVLTEPTTAVLERENQQVSRDLTSGMLEPGAHERAALLLAAFALGESAGPFSDRRPALCRLTAHLALARALRRGTPAGREARLAEIAAHALAVRQRAAVSALETAGPSKDAGEQAWLNALRLRATGDWRRLERPVTATLLERREYYRALAHTLGGLHALQFLKSRNTEPLPDWGRLSLADAPTVEEANLFAPLALDLELAEAARTYRRVHGQEVPPSRLSESLNATAGRCLSRADAGESVPRVIDWGAWAEFHARNVAQAALAAYDHLFRLLGSPDEAPRNWERTKERLRGLSLLPVVTMQVLDVQKRDAKFDATPDACRGVSSFWERTPERVTPPTWEILTRRCRPAGPPDGGQWFGKAFPRGMALDAVARRRFAERTDSASLEAVRALAPYRRVLGEMELLRRHYRVKATPADVERIFGPLVDYDLAAMRTRAEAATDADELERLYQPICALDGNACLQLGATLTGFDRDDKAAAAYQQAVETGLDRVGVSRQILWVVDYYADRGRNEEAAAVARQAAEVGSEGGLSTMGWLSERLDRWDDAERYYRQVYERYGNEGFLLRFYVRADRRRPEGAYAQKARGARAKLHFELLRQVPVAELETSPARGVQVMRSSPKFERLGLNVGTLIVMVDGYRVHDFAQYRAALTFSDDPEVKLVVWGREGYAETRAPLRRAQPSLRLE